MSELTMAKVDEKFADAKQNLLTKMKEKAPQMVDKMTEGDWTNARMLFHDLYGEGAIDVKKIKTPYTVMKEKKEELK